MTVSYGKEDKRHSGFYPPRLCTEPNAETTFTMLLLEKVLLSQMLQRIHEEEWVEDP